ncbi:hypothetical protein SUGI_0192640 [Cryptomeria japonica]|nr:hypothetical protein SUGI_0192640 [Cryptomeria japonica]
MEEYTQSDLKKSGNTSTGVSFPACTPLKSISLHYQTQPISKLEIPTSLATKEIKNKKVEPAKIGILSSVEKGISKCKEIFGSKVVAITGSKASTPRLVKGKDNGSGSQIGCLCFEDLRPLHSLPISLSAHILQFNVSKDTVISWSFLPGLHAIKKHKPALPDTAHVQIGKAHKFGDERNHEHMVEPAKNGILSSVKKGISKCKGIFGSKAVTIADSKALTPRLVKGKVRRYKLLEEVSI